MGDWTDRQTYGTRQIGDIIAIAVNTSAVYLSPLHTIRHEMT